MAGINYLYDEYKKDPSRVEKLLDSNIEITEQLDGSRFLMQVAEGNELKFYKRNDALITKIDRTLAKYYEKAIDHFENLPEEKLSEIPEGWRFGMQYFPNLQPVTITYDRLPLNNLVLTDIHVKDPNDKTIEIITEKSILEKWADIIEVEKPPIVFEGKLDDKQKEKIFSFLNTTFDNLAEKFKTENFTTYILNLLNPKLKSSFLNNDVSKDIEGLLFRFDGKVALRLINPRGNPEKEKREGKPSDIYNLTLVMIQEFLIGLDFKKIKVKEKTFEERYIEFISKVYNLFLETSTYKQNFEKGVDFELPTFLSRADSKINFKFVKDQTTNNNLQKSSTNRELFKIFLASMRTRKKKPSGFFSKDLIYHHNKLVDSIADYINVGLKENIFYTFGEFKAVFLNESEETETERYNSLELTVSEVPQVNEVASFRASQKATAYDNIEVAVNTLKKIFDIKEIKPTRKSTPVCVIKGKFQPFHNGHEAIVKDATDETGMKVFLLVTGSDIPESLHQNLMEEIATSDSNIAGFAFTEGRSFNEMLKDIPKTFSCQSYSGSAEQCEDAIVQLGKEFKVVQATNHISASTILQKLKDDDIDGYKKLVPKKLHNFFYKLKSELVKD